MIPNCERFLIGPENKFNTMGWTCAKCGSIVSDSKTSCGKSFVNQHSSGNITVYNCPGAKPAPGDWTCPSCKDHVFGSKKFCSNCSTTKPVAPVATSLPSITKPGDWTCPSCGDNVFARKTQCRCGTSKPGDATKPSSGIQKPGDWTCPSCGDNVFARKTQCRCGTSKP